MKNSKFLIPKQLKKISSKGIFKNNMGIEEKQ